MTPLKRIVITGSRGFIGQALVTVLSEIGEVWEIDQFTRPGERRIQANLLNPETTRDAIERVFPFDILIHLAALAHGQRPALPENMVTINTKITANVLLAVDQRCPHFIFFSSVAVYGEYGRHTPVRIDAELRPSTEYGMSKKICEEMIFNTSLPNIDILRLAPVYDGAHMTDVRKRVFPGGVPIKIKMFPPPLYSLCHITTLIRTVMELVQRGPEGRNYHNVADEKTYDQHAIANWFPGISLLFPVFLIRPLYWLARIFPGHKGYELRCLYSKLFHSNVYIT